MVYITLLLHKYQFASFASSMTACNVFFCCTVLLVHILHTAMTQASTAHIPNTFMPICRTSRIFAFLSVSSFSVYILSSLSSKSIWRAFKAFSACIVYSFSSLSKFFSLLSHSFSRLAKYSSCALEVHLCCFTSFILFSKFLFFFNSSSSRLVAILFNSCFCLFRDTIWLLFF